MEAEKKLKNLKELLSNRIQVQLCVKCVREIGIGGKKKELAFLDLSKSIVSSRSLWHHREKKVETKAPVDYFQNVTGGEPSEIKEEMLGIATPRDIQLTLPSINKTTSIRRKVGKNEGPHLFEEFFIIGAETSIVEDMKEPTSLGSQILFQFPNLPENVQWYNMCDII